MVVVGKRKNTCLRGWLCGRILPLHCRDFVFCCFVLFCLFFETEGKEVTGVKEKDEKRVGKLKVFILYSLDLLSQL